jgi:hypothetical protein
MGLTIRPQHRIQAVTALGFRQVWSHQHTTDAAHHLWNVGMYGLHLERWLRAVQFGVVIPTVDYFSHADVTLTKLVDIYEERYGRRVPFRRVDGPLAPHGAAGGGGGGPRGGGGGGGAGRRPRGPPRRPPPSSPPPEVL